MVRELVAHFLTIIAHLSLLQLSNPFTTCMYIVACVCIGNVTLSHNSNMFSRDLNGFVSILAKYTIVRSNTDNYVDNYVASSSGQSNFLVKT